MGQKLNLGNLRVIEGSGAANVKAERQPVAIEAAGVRLDYPLGPFVRGSLKAGLMSLFGAKQQNLETQYVPAIRNLTLSVSQGERVGIIGSNGSGKSTLLRALAGVYPLTEGSITVAGQIGTLLDIGLGFEIEATGRENIYYRGMAMGYSRAELAAAEAEIIAFADLREFIDLPMRTYSSGMYVRLGFAVSTHFFPEIMLIDEVFAAGDAAFAEKALQRMKRIVDQAGIVMLATHDMPLVERICTRVLWVKRGAIEMDAPPSVVVPAFQRYMSEGAG